MNTATEGRLNEARRRIARLEARAKDGTAESRSRMQRYLEALHRDEVAARASARTEAKVVAERLEQLDDSLDLAEQRIAAELAATEGEFTLELKETLDRMQTKAAATTDELKTTADSALAGLRRKS